MVSIGVISLLNGLFIKSGDTTRLPSSILIQTSNHLGGVRRWKDVIFAITRSFLETALNQAKVKGLIWLNHKFLGVIDAAMTMLGRREK
jgi:hypothetical protein